ncbi:MAG: adenylosuccinate synthetase [Lachnospiraceae bacterium]|nr:adenylosuccinate synthetase [Lachnospiraceae bacterium]
MVYSVIGSNFGDEGKGLATDYLASKAGTSLVVRHNGGAQSGHTVELSGPDVKRFVFHELSSGSFRHADTYWAETYFPDMYKLDEEIEAFHDMEGFFPCIYASPDCNITTIDDILLNMLFESEREQRHGSCGMGINEADLRKKAGFGITFKELFSYDEYSLYLKLLRIRRNYSDQRRSGASTGTYLDMLTDDMVLMNFAEKVIRNRKYVTICNDAKELFHKYDRVIFEGGQGLQLDSEMEANQPHVTASRTGLNNVLKILKMVNIKLDEAIYVSRTYLTKHGAGPLANENSKIKEKYGIVDNTNVENEWQGAIRYATWDNPRKSVFAVKQDLQCCPYPIRTSQFITHLNETGDRVLFAGGDLSIAEYMNHADIRSVFDSYYLSRTPFSEDVIKVDTKTES